MKIILYVFLIFILNLQVAYSGTIPITNTNIKLPSILFERSFGDTDYMYQNKAVVLLPKEKAFFVTGLYAGTGIGKTIVNNTEGIWIWKINDAGEKKADLRISNVLDARFVDLYDIRITNDNKIIIVASLVTGQSVLIILNTAGDILLLKKIEQRTHVSKIILTNDNNILLIGHQSLDALLLKIDFLGKVLWSKALDRGQSEMFVDGLATEDGGFVLIENSGKVEQFFTGTSDLFITRYDSTGNKVSEKFLQGRYGSIVKGGNGEYAVVYDNKSDASQDIWVQAYDKDLNPLWSRNIMSTNFGLEKFKIASLSNGNYVVAGSVIGKQNVTYIDATGAKKWDYLSQEQEFGVGTDIACSGSDCYLMSSIITLNAEKALNNKIRVIRYQPQ